MYEHCRGCIRYLKSCSGLSKAVCEKHQLRIPRTNADRIRAMNDEKLADLMEDKGDCPPIECPHDGEGAKVTRLDCMACWLDWLKQEAGE